MTPGAPVGDLVQTKWSVEEAMAFVMTGGINAPDRLRFNNPPQEAGPS